MPEMNTTDPITLSLMLWDDYELVRALADKFTEKYPNITVELRYTTTGTVNADLTNQAANKDLPDIYFWLDMVSISSTCEHPREAYELMKYVCWGKEGWLERIELWPTITYESGEPIYRNANCLPMLQDEELQAAMLTVLPDLGYWNDWEGFLANITSPATFGGRTIPGFNTFINDYYHNSDFNAVYGVAE